MDRATLGGYLARGLSFEAIGRLVGRDPSTVAYWAKKHGLRSSHVDRHTPRGPIPRERLEVLVEEGLTVRELAAAVDRSTATVRHWLRKYDLILRRAQLHAEARAARDVGQRTLRRECARHGWTEFWLEGSGYFRCTRCRLERVSDRRRRVKEVLMAEAGGHCALCGYDHSINALEFHHVDPATKAFGLAAGGLTRGLAACRAEARKCVLLCSNCHAEVEAGVTALPLPSPESHPG
jgi:AcrR family transcriptional regulator